MTRWKRLERETAAIFGTTRNPNVGKGQSDADTPSFSIQHKARKSLPAWFLSAVAQAVRDAKPGHLPMVVFTVVRQGVRAERFVTLRLADFVEWFGEETADK
jgi:hypothetical protein